MDMLSAILSPPQAKDFTALPGAIGRFERDWKQWQKQSGVTFPEKTKVTALLKIFPQSPQTDDLKWRFTQGPTDYNSLVESVVTYAQHVQHEGAYKRGDNDMAVDALCKGLGMGKGFLPAPSEWSDYATEEVGAFYEGFTCGALQPRR